jgi:DNA-binding LacI/PurR family transcriptional regulator
VIAAAAELGFRVKLLAQSLTTKTVNLIAVVVNHIHDLSDLDLFDKHLAETQAIGKQVILVRAGSVGKLEEFLREGVAYHVDAALAFSDFADAKAVRRMFGTEQVIMLNGRHDRNGASPSARSTLRAAPFGGHQH